MNVDHSGVEQAFMPAVISNYNFGALAPEVFSWRLTVLRDWTGRNVSLRFALIFLSKPTAVAKAGVFIGFERRPKGLLHPHGDLCFRPAIFSSTSDLPESQLFPTPNVKNAGAAFTSYPDN